MFMYMSILSKKVSRDARINISLETVPKQPEIPEPIGHEMSIFLEGTTTHKNTAIPKATFGDNPENEKIHKMSAPLRKTCFSRESPTNQIPNPVGHEMVIFLETVPKEQKRIFRAIPKAISRDSPQQAKTTKAHRPPNEHIPRDKSKIPKPRGHEMSIFLKTAPKITKGNHSGAIPTPFLETVPIAWIPFVFFACLDCLEEYANVLAYGFYCLEKPAHFRLLRGSDIFGSFGVCWTVSKSVLISWLMGFGIFVFFWARNMLVSDF